MLRWEDSDSDSQWSLSITFEYFAFFYYFLLTHVSHLFRIGETSFRVIRYFKYLKLEL